MDLEQSVFTMGDFNMILSEINISRGHRFEHRNLHPKTDKWYSSRVHGKFTKTEHLVDHRENVNKRQRMGVV